MTPRGRRLLDRLLPGRHGSAPADRPRPLRPGLCLDPPPLAEPELTAHLAALHLQYVERVNLAVEEDRPDLVAELVEAYSDEALAVITATGTR